MPSSQEDDVIFVWKNIQIAQIAFNVKFARNGQTKPMAFEVFLIFFCSLCYYKLKITMISF